MTTIELRKAYHRRICEEIISSSTNRRGVSYPNFSDADSKASIDIGNLLVGLLKAETLCCDTLSGQAAGGRFEEVTKGFIQASFELLRHLRPGKWEYSTTSSIAKFEQYKHLADLKKAVRANKELASIIGGDYIITPDIVVSRFPVSDDEINVQEAVLDQEDVATLTPFRKRNNPSTQLLHASISCKWTIRSDRSQNTRTEALNLVRNRKGPLPHVMAVTAEPLPTRIASLALGTGDLDCVYHFALYELLEAVKIVNNEDQLEVLNTLIEGKRLRDISDLPFDLSI